jgi:LysM repeat protein
MGNGAKIGLVAVLAMIVAVVALWDRTNEDQHQSLIQQLPERPLEKPAPNTVQVTPRESTPADHLTGEIARGPLSVETSGPAASGTQAPASGAAARVPPPLVPPTVMGAAVVNAALRTPALQPGARGPESVAERRHTIRASETLYAISATYYGHGKYWKKIADANKDLIKNPNSLPVGKSIVIPPLETTQAGNTPGATTVRPSLSQTSEVTTLPRRPSTGRPRGSR